MSSTVIFRIRFFTCLILLCANNTLFASPALNPFMQQIWNNNPDIKSAEAALEAAKARKFAADKPIYNPEIDVEAERTDINALSIGFSQSVDWGNRQSAASQVANANIQAAQAELALQRTRLAEEILSALMDFHATEQMQGLARQRVKLMQDFVSNTEKREQAGDVGLQDVALARVALSEALMQQANSLAQQAENQARVSAASGLYRVDEWPAFVKEPPVIPESVKIDEYLNQLPALKALKAQYLAAKANVDLARATGKADPTFGLKAGMEESNALIGLSFSIPLNIRNNYRAEIEVANQEALRIEQLFLSASQRAKAHINGVFRRYSLTHEAWQIWKTTGLNSLKDQMGLIQTIWKSGEMSTSDYLIQSKQNVDAQETAVELSTQMWKSWLEWLVASGQIEQWIKDAN